MTERPISFGSWAIPLLMDDTKTQTRRTKGLDQLNESPDEWKVFFWSNEEAKRQMGPGWTYAESGWYARHKTIGLRLLKCPYGAPGDRLVCHNCNHEFSIAERDRAITNRNVLV